MISSRTLPAVARRTAFMSKTIPFWDQLLRQFRPAIEFRMMATEPAPVRKWQNTERLHFLFTPITYTYIYCANSSVNQNHLRTLQDSKPHYAGSFLA